MDLEYKLDIQENLPVIRLAGRFDAEAAAFVKSQIYSLVNEAQPNLLVDLLNVSFIDSLGLTALVSGLKLCRKNGGLLRLVGLQPSVRAPFELTRLDKVFEIFPDNASALAAFNKGNGTAPSTDSAQPLVSDGSN